MLDIIRRHPLGFFLAVLMHLALVALMVFGLDWINPPKIQQPTGQVVQARLVDTKQLAQAKETEQAVKKRKLEEQKKKEQQRRRETERKQQLEVKKQEEQKKKAEKKKREEQRKKAEAEKKRKLALKKKEEEKKKKLELERKKKLEQEKDKKEEARKKAEAKKKAEARKKAEAKKKAEEKRKKEAERKRKAEAKRIAEQKAREEELQAQWVAEKDGRERASVTAAIKRKVQNSWLRPPTASDADLQATVRVRLNDNGSVLLVQVLKSSGNSAFDRSVVAAVNKADPLPMPKSPTLLSEFREFTFIFRPTK